jgi:hypothetical protein
MNGLAASPTFSAAIPTAPEMTRICSTLKDAEAVMPESPDLALTPRPKKFTGIRPVKNAVHEPVEPVYALPCTCAPTPG